MSGFTLPIFVSVAGDEAAMASIDKIAQKNKAAIQQQLTDLQHVDKAVDAATKKVKDYERKAEAATKKAGSGKAREKLSLPFIDFGTSKNLKEFSDSLKYSSLAIDTNVRKLAELFTQFNNFNGQVRAAVSSLTILTHEQNAGFLAIEKQRKALTDATAANDTYSESIHKQTVQQKAALATKQQAVLIEEQLLAKIRDVERETALLGKARYQDALKAELRNKARRDEITELERLKIKLAETQRAIADMQKGPTGTRRRLLVSQEELKGLEDLATFSVRTSNSLKKLQQIRDELGKKDSKVAKSAVLEQENKGLVDQATFATRLNNALAELQRTKASLMVGGAAAQAAILREENKGLEQQATFAARTANALAELQRIKASLQSGGSAAQAAVLKEENKGLTDQATFATRTANALAELQRIKTSLRLDGKSAQAAILKEENKGLTDQTTFAIRTANALSELQRIKTALQAGGASAQAAILKEENKGLTDQATFAVRNANALKELKRIKDSLLINGRSAQVAILREENKGLTDQATFATRTANALAELQRVKASLQSGGNSAQAAILKEENKGLTDQATFATRTTNALAELQRVKASLQSGGASAQAAKLKEENKGLTDQATFAQRTANALAELQRVKASLASGGASAQAAILKAENKAVEQSITFTARMKAAYEELERTKVYVNSSAGKAAEAMRIEIQGSKELAGYLAKQANLTARLAAEKAFLATNDAKNQAQLKVEVDLTRKILELKAQELAKTELMKAQLGALTEAERRDQAVQAERLRLMERNAKLQALQTGEIKALLAANAALEASYRKTAVSMRGFNVEAGATNQAMAALRSSLYGMGASFGMYTSGTILMASAVYGLVRATKESLTTGMDYEDMLNRVGAISVKAAYGTEAYKAGLAALDEKALSVAATTRFMASDVVAAMKELGMAGLKVEQVIGAVESVMRLASIGALDFGQAADIATNVMFGFRLNVEDLTDVVDVLARSAVDSNQSIQQIGNAMSYAAPIASSFGISLEFVAASTQVLANAGIKASRAGTSLRRIFLTLMAPTKNAAAAMEKLGLAAGDVGEDMSELQSMENPIKGLFEGAEYSTEALIDKLQHLYIVTDGARQNVGELAKISGLWAAPAMMQLVSSLDAADGSLLSIAESLKYAGGAAEDMYLKISDSLKGSWEYLKGAAQAAAIGLYKSEESGLRQFIDDNISTVQAIADSRIAIESFVDGIKSIGAALLKVIALFVAFKASMMIYKVITGLGVAMLWLAGTLRTTWAGFTGLAASAAAATASLTAATAASRLATGAMALLGKTIPMIIAGAAITGIMLLVDWFTNLSGSVKEASDTILTFKDVIDSAKLERQTRFENLTKPDGDLAQYLKDRRAMEDELLEISRSPVKSAEQSERLAELRKSLAENQELIAKSQQFLREYAKTTLGSNISQMRSEVESLEEQLRELDQKKAPLEAKLNTGGPKYRERLREDIAEIDKAREELASSIRNFEIKLAEADVQSYLAMTGSAEDQLKQLEIKNATMLAELNMLKERRDLLAANINTPDANPEFSKQKDEIAGLTAEIEILERAIASVKEAKQWKQRILADFTPEKIYSVGKGVIQEQVENARAAEMAETDLLNIQTIAAAERKRIAQEALDAHSAKLESDYKNIKAIQELGGSADAVNEIMLSMVKTDSDLAKESLQLSAAQGEQIETSDKLRKILEDLASKYDPMVKAQVEWRSALEGLNALHKHGWSDLDKYGRNLRGVAEDTFELDKETGKLTESSKDAAKALLEEAQASLIAAKALANQRKQALDAIPKRPDTATAQMANDLRVTLVELKEGIKTDTSWEAFIASVTRAAENDIARYTEVIKVLQEVLNGTLDRTKQTKSELKEIKDQTDAIATVLDAAGRTDEATALRRAREIKSADEQAKSLIRLRHAFEDLERVKQKAIDREAGSMAFSAQMAEDTLAAEELRARLMASGDFETLLEGYDAGPVVNEIMTIKQDAGEALGEMFAELTDYGLSFAEQITKAFELLHQGIRDSAGAMRTELAQIGGYSGQGTTYSQVKSGSGGPTGQLLDLVASKEANSNGYNTVYAAYQKEFDRRNPQGLESLTLQQVLEEMKVMRTWLSANGKPSTTAMGRYQFTNTGDNGTLQALIGSSGLSLDTKFSKGVQDMFGEMLLKQRGMDKWLAGGDTKTFAKALSQEWAAFPDPATGKSSYAGIAGNASGISVEAFVAQLEAIRASSNSPQEAAAQIIAVGEAATAVAPQLEALRKEKDALTASDEALADAMASAGEGLKGQVDAALKVQEEALAKKKLLQNEYEELKKRERKTGLEDPEIDRLKEIERQQKVNDERLKNSAAVVDNVNKQILLSEGKVYKARKLAGDELEAAKLKYDALYRAEKEHAATVNLLVQAYDSGAMSLRQFNEEMERSALLRVEAEGGWSEYWVSLKRSTQDLTGIFIDVADTFRESLIDAIVAGKLELADFGDLFKRKAAELVVNNVTTFIIGGLSGATQQYQQAMAMGQPGGAQGAGGFSSMGIGSWMKNMGSASIGQGYAGMFDKAYLNLGGTAEGLATPGSWANSFSGAAGSLPNWAYGVGGFAGGLAGDWVGGQMFGNKGYSQVGGALGGAGGAQAGMVAGTAIMPGIGTIIGGVLGALAGGAGGGFLGSMFGGSKPKPPRADLAIEQGYMKVTKTNDAWGDATELYKGVADINAALDSLSTTLGDAAWGARNAFSHSGQTLSTDNAEQWMKDQYEAMVKAMIDAAKSDALSDAGGALMGEILGKAFEEAGDDPQAIAAAISGVQGLYDALYNAARKYMTIGEGTPYASLDAAAEHLWSMTETMKVAGETLAQTLERLVKVLDGATTTSFTNPGFMDMEFSMGGDRNTLAYRKSTDDYGKYLQSNVDYWDDQIRNGDQANRAVHEAYKAAAIAARDAYVWVITEEEKSLFLVEKRAQIIQKMADKLGGIDNFNAMQNSYYQLAYSEDEQAENAKKYAQGQIDSWNTHMGFAGEAKIDSVESLRKWMEGLDLSTEAGQAAYVEGLRIAEMFGIMKDAMDALGESMMTLDEFMEALKPPRIKEKEEKEKFEKIFKDLNIQIPLDTEALYRLLQSGTLTQAQIDALLKESQFLLDYLNKGDDTDYSGDITNKTIRELEGMLDAAQKSYDKNKQTFDSATDAINSLRNLTETEEGIRDSAADQARAALRMDELPDDIGRIIDDLGNINQDDYRSYEEYLAAIQESENLLRMIRLRAGNQMNYDQQQIDLLKEQIAVEKEAQESLEEALRTEIEDLKKMLDDANRATQLIWDEGFGALIASFDHWGTLQVAALDSVKLSAELQANSLNTMAGSITAGNELLAGKLDTINTTLLGGGVPTPPPPGTGGGEDGTDDNPQMADLLYEVRMLRAETRETQLQLLIHTRRGADQLARWEGDGLPPDREDYLRQIASNTRDRTTTECA